MIQRYHQHGVRQCCPPLRKTLTIIFLRHSLLTPAGVSSCNIVQFHTQQNAKTASYVPPKNDAAFVVREDKHGTSSESALSHSAARTFEIRYELKNLLFAAVFAKF